MQMTEQPPDAWVSNSGVIHRLTKPDPSLITIQDVAHHLAYQCRWTGGTSRFYSIAEHALRVAELVPPTLRFDALMHDAAEFILGDVSRPLKMLISDYRILEHMWELAVCERFGCLNGVVAVQIADDAMAATERRDLFECQPPVGMAEPLRNYDWSALFIRGAETMNARALRLPPVAEAEFLFAFEEYKHYARNP